MVLTAQTWHETSTANQSMLRDKLLDNAAHYGDGKPVDVDWQCDEQSVSITIRDRGPGIPDEHKEAVFRPFYRLETARSTHTGGSGLGLAIARQLAIKHGRSISCHAGGEVP